MSKKPLFYLSIVLGFLTVAVIGGFLAATQIESPADVAARTAPPTPSPILVPVEKRVLSSNIVTRGTARFGLPQPVSLVPSVLKSTAGLITTLPLRNTQFGEGAVMLTASGRPVFLFRGKITTFRDFIPGLSGEDVRQLEQGLKRLGFDPGPIDGRYDEQTSHAVAKWYEKAGWEPFAPTQDQLVRLRALERELSDREKTKAAAASAAEAAALVVESARATADQNIKMAISQLSAKQAAQRTLVTTNEKGVPLAVETARAKAEQANRAAAAEVEARMADRALVMMDPRTTRTARAAADAQLQLARAVAQRTQLEGEMAIQAAERDAKLIPEQLNLAEAAVKSAQLEGEKAVKAALDARKMAELDAKLAVERADRTAADLALAKRKLGVQLPADEIVFLPSLPVRVEEVTAQVGHEARGLLLKVTDNQLSIDSSLTLETAPLVKPGLPVQIDEQALGIKTTGVVQRVAETPGTHGVDGYHIYFVVRVHDTPTRLEGFSLRLTIPIESTKGVVTAVPLSAVSLAADGTSRLQVQQDGVLKYMVVEPGLSADGYVEVTPVDGTLEEGQLVVVGYENPANTIDMGPT